MNTPPIVNYKVGLIENGDRDVWIVYHRERAPFAKWGTRRVIDIYCASQRIAEHLCNEMQEHGDVAP